MRAGVLVVTYYYCNPFFKTPVVPLNEGNILYEIVTRYCKQFLPDNKLEVMSKTRRL